jgi:hypothetical protein
MALLLSRAGDDRSFFLMLLRKTYCSRGDFNLRILAQIQESWASALAMAAEIMYGGYIRNGVAGGNQHGS